uniref:Uncharacterized protein n=1 Tax=Nelumbo nucifera TaxID=4432 RepID=A0A822ZTM5_NELNU|nr:TPA_asm: hypothetical protein HUJ06_016596 [Nelumbo nucifera]
MEEMIENRQPIYCKDINTFLEALFQFHESFLTTNPFPLKANSKVANQFFFLGKGE